MTNEFDPFKAGAALLSELPVSSGRRLTFHDRCAVYAALQIGFRSPTISKAFGVSRQTVNHISGCNAGRYDDIAREFAALGDNAFVKRYYTDSVHDRLSRVKANFLRAADDRSVKGPDRGATLHSGPRSGPFFAGRQWWWINWTTGAGHPQGEGGPGWRFTHCGQDCTAESMLPADHFYQGRESVDVNPYGETKACPFRTASQAHKAVLTIYEK